MLFARPDIHLVVLGLLPAGDDVDPEAAVADRVDRHRHPRREGRRHRQNGHGGVEPDLLGHRRQPRHQGEALQGVVPEVGRAAEAVQLDHREREIEAVLLRLQRHGLVEVEARQVLRRGRRHDPAVVGDRNEDADVHLIAFPPRGRARTAAPILDLAPAVSTLQSPIRPGRRGARFLGPKPKPTYLARSFEVFGGVSRKSFARPSLACCTRGSAQIPRR